MFSRCADLVLAGNPGTGGEVARRDTRDRFADLPNRFVDQRPGQQIHQDYQHHNRQQRKAEDGANGALLQADDGRKVGPHDDGRGR
jgi:hypothetical protein